MGWIIAAISTEFGDPPSRALEEFGKIAAVLPAAPWKIETGHLRGGRDRLEQITGRSWAEVSLSPDEVRETYEKLVASSELRDRGGLTAALISFLEVCTRHRLGLEGGEGARATRQQPRADRPG